MKLARNLALAGVASATSMYSQTFAAIDFGGNRVAGNVSGAADTAENTVQRLVGNVLLFLGIVAVLYAIYGGFLIMTAGGEDDKVGQGKKILIQGAIGLVVIFLANSIVQFILSRILAPAAQ